MTKTVCNPPPPGGNQGGGGPAAAPQGEPGGIRQPPRSPRCRSTLNNCGPVLDVVIPSGSPPECGSPRPRLLDRGRWRTLGGTRHGAVPLRRPLQAAEVEGGHRASWDCPPWGKKAGFLVPWAGENIDSRLNPRIVGAPQKHVSQWGGPIEGDKAASDSPWVVKADSFPPPSSTQVWDKCGWGRSFVLVRDG